MKNTRDTRVRNPFKDPLMTELIEEPSLYHKMFSERILIGETLAVFQPVNVALAGPQGSGKSMILNMIRYPILSEWISKTGMPPAPLKHLAPFFGISVNLARINFQAFGRRSVSMVLQNKIDRAIDLACAADFLNHYFFREFLKGIQYVLSDQGSRFAEWLGINPGKVRVQDIVADIASWQLWFGYYSDCGSLESLLDKCNSRLNTWRSFLNTNIDKIPMDIWESKSSLGEPLHAMGNLLSSITSEAKHLPLFAVIDQYEVLPELNPSYGTDLQRIVNTLIKQRDPVVFYKIGARTYDWGRELRVWGSESRIEEQRDYTVINLADILMRSEGGQSWLFPSFALDVAHKRIRGTGHFRAQRDAIRKMLGDWKTEHESQLYFGKNSERVFTTLRGLPHSMIEHIKSICGPRASPLELRLAGAWVHQQRRRHMPQRTINKIIETYPWRRRWWRKERIIPALLQIAGMANERKLYFGWTSVNYLSGANISAFLLICSEIWDIATKVGLHPLKSLPLPYNIQTEGIFAASDKWTNRDRNERIGGRQRYYVFGKLGPAIHRATMDDLGISNPGHSGFSLRESDLWGGEKNVKKERVAEFLENAVSWAYLEERRHTSKLREAASRRKWYLHPLLSPRFGIPHIRVKEPLYATVDEVYEWIFGEVEPRFGKWSHQAIIKGKEPGAYQPRLPFGDDK